MINSNIAKAFNISTLHIRKRKSESKDRQKRELLKFMQAVCNDEID